MAGFSAAPPPHSPHRDREKHNSAFRHGPRSAAWPRRTCARPAASLAPRLAFSKACSQGRDTGLRARLRCHYLEIFNTFWRRASPGLRGQLRPGFPAAARTGRGLAGARPPLGAHGLAPPPPALGLPLRLCGCLCRSRLPRRPGTLPRSTAPPSFLAPLPLSLTAPRPSARTTLVALPRAPLTRPRLPASATAVPPNPAFRPPRVFSLKHRASRAVGARGAPGQSGRAPKASRRLRAACPREDGPSQCLLDRKCYIIPLPP